MMRSPSSASAISSRAQIVRRDHQHLDLAFGMAVDQRGLAGQLAHLGQELARALLHDRRDTAEAVALGDRRHGRCSTTNMPQVILPASNSCSRSA